MNSDFVHRYFAADGRFISVWLHADGDPTDVAFAKASLSLERGVTDLGVNWADVRGLVVSDGGAPTAKQRGRMVGQFGDGVVPWSVITLALRNPLKRGVATALTWLNPALTFFEPDEFDAALAHLGLMHLESRLLDELCDMARELPPNRSLERLLRSRTAIAR